RDQGTISIPPVCRLPLRHSERSPRSEVRFCIARILCDESLLGFSLLRQSPMYLRVPHPSRLPAKGGPRLSNVTVPLLFHSFTLLLFHRFSLPLLCVLCGEILSLLFRVPGVSHLNCRR